MNKELNDNQVCEYISELALKSMLFEVSATCKPGLVDRINSGAHRDMDFYMFLNSSASLVHTFYKCAFTGLDFYGQNLKDLLNQIRPIGIEGERKMFSVTNGVNTHKGLIFSLGVICAAAGIYFRKTKRLLMDTGYICNIIEEMTKGLSNTELNLMPEDQAITYGERLYRVYGTLGIRGEVESGFPTVRSKGLPLMKALVVKRIDINDILVQVLLNLMTVTEDSNILGRHDLETLEYVKRAAKEVLALGGVLTSEGRSKIIEMDKDFIKRNISPGGSADLMAVTIMFYLLENSKLE